MSSTPIEQIEKSIQRAKATQEFGAAIERLLTNRDFKTVVTAGYFEKEAIRLVHLKADPAMDSPAKQASVVAQIDAIGAFSQFLATAQFLARQADKEIAAAEETREELLIDGGANG